MCFSFRSRLPELFSVRRATSPSASVRASARCGLGSLVHRLRAVADGFEKTPSPQRRRKAVAVRRAAQSIDVLVGALRDPSVEVAVRAATAVEALGRILDATELDSLIEAARDVDATVSAAAIAALGERGGDAAATELLRIVEDRTGFYLPQTHLAAANALARALRHTAPAPPPHENG